MTLERVFEGLLWRSRYVVIAAVLASLVCSLGLFYVASVDAVYMVTHLARYAQPGLEPELRAELRADLVTHAVEIVDGFLLASILLIFGLGLYELFISDLDEAKNTRTASNVLLIESLDDLKNRLAKVVLMILIVRFFEHAIGMRFERPLDLLLLAGGIALIGLALYLSHASEGGAGKASA